MIHAPPPPTQVVELIYRWSASGAESVGAARIQTPAGPCRLTLRPDRDIEKRPIDVDLGLFCPRIAGKTDLVPDAYPFHGLQDYMFPALDPKNPLDKTLISKARVVRVQRAGVSLNPKIREVESTPIQPVAGVTESRQAVRLLDVKITVEPVGPLAELASPEETCTVALAPARRPNAIEGRCRGATSNIARTYVIVDAEKLGRCQVALRVTTEDQPRLLSVDNCGGALRTRDVGAVWMRTLMQQNRIKPKQFWRVSYQPAQGKPGCYQLNLGYFPQWPKTAPGAGVERTLCIAKAAPAHR